MNMRVSDGVGFMVGMIHDLQLVWKIDGFQWMTGKGSKGNERQILRRTGDRDSYTASSTGDLEPYFAGRWRPTNAKGAASSSRAFGCMRCCDLRRLFYQNS